MEADGGEVGVGVVVDGESSERGMELMTRSEARGLFFARRDGGEVVEDGEDGEGGVSLLRASMVASSHAVRIEGSTGQAEEEGKDRGCWIWLEEVFPMLPAGYKFVDRIASRQEDVKFGGEGLPSHSVCSKAAGRQQYARVTPFLQLLCISELLYIS